MSREILQWNKTLYLAGKAQGRKWEIVNGIHHNWIASDKVQHPEQPFDFKQDWSNHGCDRWFGNGDLTEQIKSEIIQAIRRCNGLVAYLDADNSYGSVAEIAVASTMGLPVLMLIRLRQPCECWKREFPPQECEECARDEAEIDAMRDAYLAVSCFPGVIPEAVRTDEQARQEILTIFPPHKSSSYQEYLASPEWKARRDKVIKKHGGTCALCSSTKGLQVHHKTYERVGYERDEDLIPLCSRCHGAHHGKQVVS